MCLVSETTWQRLHRIADARRKILGLTLAGVTAAGGPSDAWFRALKYGEGQPSTRHTKPLAALDSALHWKAGTSLSLLKDDRSTWDEEMLADEEDSLLHATDRAATFAFMAEQRLRVVGEEEAERMIREMSRVLGLPVIGD
jgi:hypothetical protein